MEIKINYHLSFSKEKMHPKIALSSLIFQIMHIIFSILSLNDNV